MSMGDAWEGRSIVKISKKRILLKLNSAQWLAYSLESVNRNSLVVNLVSWAAKMANCLHLNGHFLAHQNCTLTDFCVLRRTRRVWNLQHFPSAITCILSLREGDHSPHPSETSLHQSVGVPIVPILRNEWCEWCINICTWSRLSETVTQTLWL